MANKMAIEPTPKRASAGRSSWNRLITNVIVAKNPDPPELP